MSNKITYLVESWFDMNMTFYVTLEESEGMHEDDLKCEIHEILSHDHVIQNIQLECDTEETLEEWTLSLNLGALHDVGCSIKGAHIDPCPDRISSITRVDAQEIASSNTTEHAPEQPKPVHHGVKELITMGLKSKDREMVLKALRANDVANPFLTEEEVEQILIDHWDSDLVDKWTRHAWHDFCESFGGESTSGSTVDEWQPSQLGDHCTNLEGYLSLPVRLLDDQELSSCLSAWSEALHKWLCELDASIRAWCDARPEIVSYEPPCIWGERFYRDEVSSSPLEVQIAVIPKISLAKLIMA